MLEKNSSAVSDSLPPTVHNAAETEALVDDDSNSDSIQFGVKQAEAVAAAWSRKSLIIAYVGYVRFFCFPLLWPAG